ncbi:MAG: D-alanine--D-alanine ligase [Paludibacteraceae bacterium]
MKKNIAIIAGGYTSEYGVSLRSAAGIYSFMDKEKYNVRVVRIKGQEWGVYVGEEMDKLGEADETHWLPIDKNDFSYVEAGERKGFNFAYITIHGAPGENGLLQGYLEMIGMPYSCCGVLAAALTYNKFTCNHYLANMGVAISQSILLRRGQARPTDEEIAGQLGLPCFIKSNVGGSSFGCTKVKRVEDVAPAIERAFKEGDEVICEAFMKGTEITCGVYKTSKTATAFPITEVVSKNEYFDYDAKYKGESDEITPARIPDEVRDAVQALTLHIYDLLGCRGIIRVDYILTEGWKINLLEVNTTPGMTATSFIPQQVRAAGLKMGDVLGDIIENS